MYEGGNVSDNSEITSKMTTEDEDYDVSESPNYTAPVLATFLDYPQHMMYMMNIMLIGRTLSFMGFVVPILTFVNLTITL